MRQSHGGKRCQGIGTVQSKVHPLTAPPPRGNYRIREMWRERQILDSDIAAAWEKMETKEFVEKFVG